MHETMGQLDVQVRDEMIGCIQRIQTFDEDTVVIPAGALPRVCCLVARGEIAERTRRGELRPGRSGARTPRLSQFSRASGYHLAEMRPRLRFALVFAFSCAPCLFAACAQPKPEPQIASSAGEATYAEVWSGELDDLASRIAHRQESARKLFSEFFIYPSKLKDPKGVWVGEVYRKADAAGRSWNYVERMRKIEAAAAFFANEKGEIDKKVAGAAQYAIKENKEKCPCNIDVSGAIVSSLEDVYGDRLEKRMRERNEAHRVIARWHDTMPKEDVATLEDQADDLAYASYVVFYELVDMKVQLRRMLAEANEIPKTADSVIAAERAFQAQPGRTDAEKKAAEERIETMRKSRALAEQTTARGKQLSDDVEKQIAAIQKEYREAFDYLMQKLAEAAK